jgi:orotidine-5'-phosphate decarboxylase
LKTWVERLDARAFEVNSLMSVGLDPDPARMPVRDVFEFNKAIIDSTADLVCAFKPQMAFYEALGIPGLRALASTVQHIRDVAPGVTIIGDAKRGDIGSTAAAYATAMFDHWDFDAVTVHPYLGRDSVQPFLERPGRGAIVLCRTSNPSAIEFQDLLPADVDGKTVYELVADAVATWNTDGNLGIVVGATYPDEMAVLRAAHPDLPFLVPGVGAQGGEVEAATRAGINSNGRGAIINSARGIIYASSDPRSFQDAARTAAQTLRDQINGAVEMAGQGAM